MLGRGAILRTLKNAGESQKTACRNRYDTAAYSGFSVASQQSRLMPSVLRGPPVSSLAVRQAVVHCKDKSASDRPSADRRMEKPGVWRFLAPAPMPSNISGCSGGARGRNRTGMGFPPRDFRTHYSFRCCAPVRAFGVWTLPLPCRAGRELGRGRQVSTLSTPYTGLA